MKPVRDFVAARPAVQHCAELLGNAQPPFDLSAASAEFAAELALALPERLQPLLIGPRPLVSDWPAETMTASALASTWAAPSIHYAVSLRPDLPVFVASFDNASALGLTERLFGGRGGGVAEVPKVLPQSVVLSVERLVRSIAEALAQLCGTSGAKPNITAHAVFRRLGVFKRNENTLGWSLTVEQEGHDPWNLRLAVTEAAMRPVLEQRAAGAARAPQVVETDPLTGAMAAIPLPLTAILADLRLPLSRLAGLQPGDTIPLSPRREVPLAIGVQVIATGTVGSLDERVALRLTRLN
ncbi:MAG: FliM/FliN family flagellar motor C-terminal domain-containing protein [Sphingomonadaceae bacterium]